jgi:hypothetical protein
MYNETRQYDTTIYTSTSVDPQCNMILYIPFDFFCAFEILLFNDSRELFLNSFLYLL